MSAPLPSEQGPRAHTATSQADVAQQAAPDQHPHPGVARSEPDYDPHSTAVVVIDDDPDAREFVIMGLEVGGFKVVGEAGTASDAIRVVTAQQPDLILLDLHMPDMGGLELLPQLRQAHRPAKIVVMSAINATFTTEAAIEAGAVGFIVKGISPRSVNLHLERVVSMGPVKLVRPYPLTSEYP